MQTLRVTSLAVGRRDSPVRDLGSDGGDKEQPRFRVGQCLLDLCAVTIRAGYRQSRLGQTRLIRLELRVLDTVLRLCNPLHRLEFLVLPQEPCSNRRVWEEECEHNRIYDAVNNAILASEQDGICTHRLS